MTKEIWNYPGEGDWSTMELIGFQVHASDGDIGKVDDASKEVDGGYIVVETGPWIFGKKVLLPAGIITHVDFAAEKITVARTKDEIKDSPQFDEDADDEYDYDDPTYREAIGGYFGGGAL